MDRFNIPIVLFIFRRKKAVEIVKRISKVKPKKIYIIADGGRNKKEEEEVQECRKLVEEAINWDCELIKNYSEMNRGVYSNIGLGAKWVFDREESAIFLEDDNLPEVTFFKFCEELLEKYKTDTRVLWICGTNYLGKYNSSEECSYVFTKHMFPCGWASWSDKFNKFYDGNLELCQKEEVLSRIKNEYYNKKVYKQYRNSWLSEYQKIKSGKKPSSWDYQMDFSIKANGLYGICTCRNQIKNIGVDEYSIHGGSSFENIMTKRFCGMESYPIEFPLKHPTTILPDENFEKKIADIILYPLKTRVIIRMSKIVRRILKVPEDISLTTSIKDIVANLKGK